MNNQKRQYNDFDALLSESEHDIEDTTMKQRIWEKVQTQQTTKIASKQRTIAFTISKYAAILAIGLMIGLLFNNDEIEQTTMPQVVNTTQPETITAPAAVNNNVLTKRDTVFIVKKTDKKINIATPIQQNPIGENKKEEVIVAQEKTPEIGILTPTAEVDNTPIVTDKEILQHLAALNEQQPRKKINKIEKRLQKIIEKPNTQYANSITFKNAIKSF